VEKKLSTELKQITETFEETQPLRLMFQDEARFGRISDTRYCWAPYPLRPMVKAMLTHQYTYAYGAVSPMNGRFDSLVLPHVNTDCMQLFLNEIAARYPHENIIMIVDGAGWHKSKSFLMPKNLKLHFLPPYSPELNPQENLWDELREKYFHNHAFDSLDSLEAQLVDGLLYLEHNPKIVQSITGWDWIVNSISNGN
jgi:transposase